VGDAIRPSREETNEIPKKGFRVAGSRGGYKQSGQPTEKAPSHKGRGDLKAGIGGPVPSGKRIIPSTPLRWKGGENP